MTTPYQYCRFYIILLGMLSQAIHLGAQVQFCERLDYFRAKGNKSNLDLEEIRTPYPSYESIIDSITQRILTQTHGYIAYPAELGNAFGFITNPDAQKALRHLGYVRIPTALLPEKVDECAYTPWIFGEELLTSQKNKDNKTGLGRFFNDHRPIKVSQALWYYFSPNEPERLLPLPNADNLYFFNGTVGDLETIQNLLSSDKRGYIICPVWTEDITGALDNPDIYPSIRGSGTIEFLIKESPLSIALNLTPWKEEFERFKATDRVPFVYDSTYIRKVESWLLSLKELHPKTIRSFFCYFDNRSKEEIDKQITQANCSIPVFREDGSASEAAALEQRVNEYDQRAFPIVPYWLESAFERLTPESIRKFTRLEYMGYVVDTGNGQPIQVNDWQKQSKLLDMPVYKDTPFDLTVIFRHEQETNQFLKSKDAQITLLKNLFTSESGTINRAPSLRAFNGLSLYFPDFDFKSKNRRNLVQFIQSVSFTIDSFCVENNKIYKDYDLNVIFSSEAQKNIGYLSILLKHKLADRICFIDYDDMGVPLAKPIALYEDGYQAIWTDDLVNTLLYLFTPFPQGEQAESCTDDIGLLANTGYSNTPLTYFVIGGILLIILLLVSIALYWTSSQFYMFTEQYKQFMLPALFVTIAEIFLVFYFIIQITSTGDNFKLWPQVLLFVFPLLFFLLTVLPVWHQAKEPLP